MRLLIIILAIFSFGCASMRPNHEWHVAYTAAAASDTISTELALRDGGIEQNPIFGKDPHMAKIAAFKVGSYFLLRGIEQRAIAELGRELKWYEKMMVWAVPTLVFSWAAAHNMRQ